MAFNCATGLDIARADRNADGFSIAGGAAPAFYDRVKTILPKAIVFFPLPHNEPKVLAFIDDSLASRVLFSGGMVLGGPGSLCLRGGTDG